jgi:hypothetical protein
VDQALKILGIDKNASARWHVDDAEDVQVEVLARVQQRLDKMPIPDLLQLGWNGLRKLKSQELADVLDKRDAKQRGGGGGRKARKANTNVRPALHVPLESLNDKDPNPLSSQGSDIDKSEASEIPAPAAFILAIASKLSPRALQYFKAIAAGADQKSAAEVAGISTRMGRKYLQQLKALLKTED